MACLLSQGAAALEKGKTLYAQGERMDALKTFEAALNGEASRARDVFFVPAVVRLCADLSPLTHAPPLHTSPLIDAVSLFCSLAGRECVCCVNACLRTFCSDRRI